MGTPDTTQLELPLTATDTPLPAAGRDPVLEKLVDGHLLRLGYTDLAGAVSVIWNTRLGSTAGQCFAYERRITLNPKLAAISRVEVERTLLHELAHLIAHARNIGRRMPPHGREWQKACIDLGIPGESSRHRLPLPTRVIQRKFFYKCPGCSRTSARVRPFRHKEACVACCRKFNNGQYDSRFRFVKI